MKGFYGGVSCSLAYLVVLAIKIDGKWGGGGGGAYALINIVPILGQTSDSTIINRCCVEFTNQTI